MNKTQANSLDADLRKAIEKVLSDHAMDGAIKTSWDVGGNFNLKVEAKSDNAKQTAIDYGAEQLLNQKVKYGQALQSPNELYTLDCFYPNRPKYPWGVKNAVGNKFKITTKELQQMLP